jgi:glutaminyl-peptide cyclotransferase
VRALLPVLARLVVLLAGSVGVSGCETSQAPATGEAVPEEPPAQPADPTRFSAERAFGDLRALVAIGPRVSGTEGAERARAYLRGELAAQGFEVVEIDAQRRTEGAPETPLRHLSVTLPGASPDRFLLVAPYDTSRFTSFEFVGANDGASGAAVLLELARVLKVRQLPYTTQLVFLDGEGRADGEGEGEALERWRGSAALAGRMRENGELEGIRLLVAFHQVCDAELRIARDLSSNRVHREEFFKAARRIGRPDGFPTDRGFETVAASHDAFREAGVRGALVISDTRYGGDTVPGAFAETADDTPEHCAPESLEVVGAVTLEALDTIGRRLAKIDRFTRSPLADAEAAAAERPSTGEDDAAQLP